MSLKAKIEAIIYAAEEPVTLAQLVSLLGEEAQAELDRRAALQITLALSPSVIPLSEDGIPLPSEPEDLNDEALEPPDLPDLEPDPEDDEPLDTPHQTQPELQPELQPEDDAADPPLPAAPSHLPPPAPLDDPPAPLPGTDPSPALSSVPGRPLARDQRARERALRDFLRSLLDDLIRDYSTSDRGLEIREVASGFRLSTKPEYHDAVRGFARGLKPPLKLSLPALETLAVVAYKQPITAPEVAEIRGVDSAGVLGSLLGRKLVATAGRKPVVGRPILYKTTKDFLLRFGLRDLHELPSIEEFERMAGDLADAEPQQEEIPMAPLSPDQVPADHQDPRNPNDVTAANLREEADVVEPQADGDDGEENPGLPVDGRLSGVDIPEPQPIDSSAGDAAIQQDQIASEGEDR